MSIKSCLSALAIALPMLAIMSTPADAHRRWLMPSATVLSGDTETVTVDAAASNGLFIFEHRPLPLDDLKIVGPDGEEVAAKVIGSGTYRSVFDVPLAKQGTYRIALVNGGLMGFYMVDGDRKRWRGTLADLDGAIPEGATDIRISKVAGRTETFTTLGAPNDVALQPTGEGLEMVPVTHPNDLVVGEPARFRFLIDGEPAAAMEVEWVEGGTRYRDTPGLTTLTTDADGMVEVMVDAPGLYYLEAGVRDDEAATADARVQGSRASYTAVLEFLPL